MAHFLELSQIIDHQATKEGVAIFQSRLINHNRRALSLDALHDALNGTLAEVIAVTLHGQTVHTDGHRLFLFLVVLVIFVIAVVTSQLQDTISDEVFTSSITFDNRLNQVLRHICVVCQQLLGILRQAVSAVAKTRIIVVATDTRIEADSINDLLGVQALAFCIGVQFVKISNTKSQICIGEQLNSLCLSEAHKQSIDVLLDSTFLQQTSELMSGLNQMLIVQVSANDDTAWIQIVIQSLRLAQKLRTENDILAVELLTHTCGVVNRNGGLDDHDGIRVILHDQLDYSFDCARVEVLRVAVVVRRGRNYNKVRIRICSLCIQSCGQVQFFFCEILFDIVILNWGLTVVDHVHLLRDNIHSSHLMVLRKQCGNRKAHITGSSYGNFIILHLYFILRHKGYLLISLDTPS